ATYNGLFPGPTLRRSLGEELNVRLLNQLDAPIGLHWSGVHVQNKWDGSILTQPPLKTGETLTYQFVPPDPGLFLYHASGTYGSWTSDMHGLAGILIVEEKQPPVVDREILLVLHDKMLQDKQMEEIKVRPGARIRLRLVNLTRAELMQIRFDGVQPFVAAI